MNDLCGKTVLVTGGAGFIGSHTCEALLTRGAAVVSIDNFNDFYDPAIKRRNIADVEKTAAWHEGSFLSVEADIRDSNAMDRIFAEHNPDIVVHLAAYAGVRPSIENPRLYFDVNVMGTVTLMECMKKHGVGRMAFASSSSIYGNNEKLPFSETDPADSPISPYAASKKSGELLCHVYHELSGMSIACLRFFTVYGPRQRPDLAIYKFTALIDRGLEIPLFGDGGTERDYTYIDDTIKGVMAAVFWTCGETPGYQVFNLGESRTISLSHMVATIEKALGKRASIRRFPDQPGDVEKTYADIGRAADILNYAPDTGFETGISEFVRWYRTIHETGTADNG